VRKLDERSIRRMIAQHLTIALEEMRTGFADLLRQSA